MLDLFDLIACISEVALPQFIADSPKNQPTAMLAHEKIQLIFTQKEIASITIDPLDETADGDRHNNRFPRLPIDESFQLQEPKKTKNAMQQLKRQDETKNEDDS